MAENVTSRTTTISGGTPVTGVPVGGAAGAGGAGGTTPSPQPIDLSGPAAAAALTIAAAMYEKLIPLRPPAEATPEHLAQTLTTQARQVGVLAWEILYGLQTPRRP